MAPTRCAGHAGDGNGYVIESSLGGKLTCLTGLLLTLAGLLPLESCGYFEGLAPTAEQKKQVLYPPARRRATWSEGLQPPRGTGMKNRLLFDPRTGSLLLLVGTFLQLLAVWL